MADGGQAYPKCGPWHGVNEASSTIGDVVRSLNVSFEGGKIRRRPGRRRILDSGTALRVSRIFEHVSLSGARETLAALTSPSDPTAPAKIVAFSPSGGGYRVVADLHLEPASPEEFFWAASYKGGRTILSAPSGRLFMYDGVSVAPLAAMQGLDAQNALAASRAYLWGPPLASMVLVWRNRIAALRRRTIGLSADANDTTVPWDAPASGANVWPASTNLDVLTQEGDEIMGAAVQADRLACFMRRGVVVVDEDSVSPIPRIADKQYGCVAPRSVVEIGGGLVAYLADRSVCVFNGTTAGPISDDISETLKLVNWHAAYRAVGVHLAQKQEYRLWLPLRGRYGNQICVIYDYRSKKWRVYAGGIPWMAGDYGSWRNFDVTAAAAVLLPSGEEVLLTGSSDGQIWREDIGETDEGLIAPAYFALAPMRDGAAVEKWADWRVHAKFDGSWIVGIPLEHGEGMEQEISRYFAGGADLESEIASLRAIDDAGGHALQTYGGATWGGAQHTPQDRTRRLGARANTRSMQPLVILPGQVGGLVDTAPGAISEIEFAVAPAGGRRG